MLDLKLGAIRCRFAATTLWRHLPMRAINVARLATLVFLVVARFIWGNGDRPWPVFASSSLVATLLVVIEVVMLVRARAGLTT